MVGTFPLLKVLYYEIDYGFKKKHVLFPTEL